MLNEVVVEFLQGLPSGRHYTARMLSARIYKATGVQVSAGTLSKQYIPAMDNIEVVRTSRVPYLYRVI